MRSETVDRFWQLYHALPAPIRQAAREAYRQFAIDPSHPGLHFHKLEGHPDVWAVRIIRDYRAVGLKEGDTVTWFWVGSHQDFNRTFPR